MFLSVIIPAYNEEKRLPETLKKVKDYLSRQNYQHEVLVVDDGSVDQTPQGVGRLIQDWPEFKIIGYQPDDFLISPDLWFKIIHPDDRSSVAQVTQQMIKNKEKKIFFKERSQ